MSKDTGKTEAIRYDFDYEYDSPVFEDISEFDIDVSILKNNLKKEITQPITGRR